MLYLRPEQFITHRISILHWYTQRVLWLICPILHNMCPLIVICKHHPSETYLWIMVRCVIHNENGTKCTLTFKCLVKLDSYREKKLIWVLCCWTNSPNLPNLRTFQILVCLNIRKKHSFDKSFDITSVRAQVICRKGGLPANTSIVIIWWTSCLHT